MYLVIKNANLNGQLVCGDWTATLNVAMYYVYNVHSGPLTLRALQGIHASVEPYDRQVGIMIMYTVCRCFFTSKS